MKNKKQLNGMVFNKFGHTGWLCLISNETDKTKAVKGATDYMKQHGYKEYVISDHCVFRRENKQAYSDGYDYGAIVSDDKSVVILENFVNEQVLVSAAYTFFPERRYAFKDIPVVESNIKNPGLPALSFVCLKALSILQHIVNNAAECNRNIKENDKDENNAGWFDRFALDSIKRSFIGYQLSDAELVPYEDGSFWDEVFKLPHKEKFILGFRSWSEASDKMLIPSWILECLPENYVFEAYRVLGGNIEGPIKISRDMDDYAIISGALLI